MLAKNIARTARRQLEASAIWRIFTDLNDPLSPKHALSKMNLDGDARCMFQLTFRLGITLNEQ